MKLALFDYALPEERIAQEPAEPRDSARMLVLERGSGVVRHRFVRDLPDELAPGDLLVRNDTRVRRARLFARRASGGAVELLLLGPVEGSLPRKGDGPLWRALVRPAGKLVPGEVLAVEGGALRARVHEREAPEPGADGGSRVWTLELRDPERPERGVEELLEAHGHPPLPPYIRRARGKDPREAGDLERYQTVYAEKPGAVAAPTAGLHFTAELFERLAARGVEHTSLTLHVGLGTFQPVTAEDTDQHHMHAEWFEVGPESVRAVERARARGGKVVAVGTTCVRALESAVGDTGALVARSGGTRLFLQPGHRFRTVDGLLTNFHLPRSTLLVLVSAFAGRERVLALYMDAIERGYRFYSYGDAMLILP
jgi:S-adenosylmethionine:tRNA ribosyltransferase-isomerase